MVKKSLFKALAWAPTTIALNYPLMVQAASLPDQVGIGASTTATAGANIAVPPPEFAAYFNPAGIRGDGDKAAFGIVYTDFDLKDLNGGYAQNPGSPLPVDTYRASKAASITALTFGYKTDVFGPLDIGLAGVVPENLMEIHGSSGSELHYLQYNDRQLRPELFVGLGWQLPQGFSLGFGGYMSLEAQGQVQAGLSADESRGRVRLKTKPQTLPTYGVAYETNLGEYAVAAGASYREGHLSSVNLDTQVVAGSESFRLPTEILSNLAAFYTPPVIRSGISFTRGDWSLHTAYEIYQWSEFKPPVLALGGSAVSTVAEDAQPTPNIRAQDAEVLRLGGEWRSGFATWRLGLERHSGVRWKSSGPAPVVDMPRSALSFGSGIDITSWFDKPGGSRSFSLDFSAHYARLDATEVTGLNGDQVSAGGTIISYMGGISRVL